MKQIARKVFRIGVQTLWYNPDEDQYYVKIQNRTYTSMHPVPIEKVPIWRERLS